MVSQRPQFDFKREVLEIDYVPTTTKFHFAYWEDPFAKQHWAKQCSFSEAFSTFERILHLKKWLVEEVPVDGVI